MDPIIKLENAFECLESIRVLMSRQILAPMDTLYALGALVQRTGDIVTSSDDEMKAKDTLVDQINLTMDILAGSAGAAA